MKPCSFFLLLFLCFSLKYTAAMRGDSTSCKLHFGVSVSYLNLWIPSQRSWRIEPSWSTGGYLELVQTKEVSIFSDFGVKHLNLLRNGSSPWYFTDVASLNPYSFNLQHNRLFLSLAVSYKFKFFKMNSVSLKVGASVEQIISGFCNYYLRDVQLDSSGQPYITEPEYYSIEYNEDKSNEYFSPNATFGFFASTSYRLECIKLKPTIELTWTLETKNIGSKMAYAEGAVLNPGYSEVYRAPNYFQLKISFQII